MVLHRHTHFCGMSYTASTKERQEKANKRNSKSVKENKLSLSNTARQVFFSFSQTDHDVSHCSLSGKPAKGSGLVPSLPRACLSPPDQETDDNNVAKHSLARETVVVIMVINVAIMSVPLIYTESSVESHQPKK